MADVLAKILAQKRPDLARRMAARPLAELKSGLKPSQRSLKAALSQRGARFVMEMKRASPSKGSLNPHLVPEDVARSYRPYAAAMSVLTDTPFFGGSFQDLEAVRKVFLGPILCKDFVIDPYQIAEARFHGADAILLMLSVLDDDAMKTALTEVKALGMEALVEVHTEAEMDRALRLEAPILGINARDLKTLKVSLNHVRSLTHRVPLDRLLIAESGIQSHVDVLSLAPEVDAFLVGGALVSARDTRQAAAELTVGRVKICGLTRARDAEIAFELGASWGGLVFAEGSPRQVDLKAAERLVKAVPGAYVGVFRDQALGFIVDAQKALSLRAVQLHGHEDAAFRRALKATLPEGVELWQAVSAASLGKARLDAALKAASEASDRLLLDGAEPGSGEPHDWAALAAHSLAKQCWLAGGIGPTNAAKAKALGFYGLDLSSGVESEKGQKSESQLQALFAALRPDTRGDK